MFLHFSFTRHLWFFWLWQWSSPFDLPHPGEAFLYSPFFHCWTIPTLSCCNPVTPLNCYFPLSWVVPMTSIFSFILARAIRWFGSLILVSGKKKFLALKDIWKQTKHFSCSLGNGLCIIAFCTFAKNPPYTAGLYFLYTSYSMDAYYSLMREWWWLSCYNISVAI